MGHVGHITVMLQEPSHVVDKPYVAKCMGKIILHKRQSEVEKQDRLVRRERSAGCKLLPQGTAVVAFEVAALAGLLCTVGAQSASCLLENFLAPTQRRARFNGRRYPVVQGSCGRIPACLHGRSAPSLCLLSFIKAQIGAAFIVIRRLRPALLPRARGAGGVGICDSAVSKGGRICR